MGGWGGDFFQYNKIYLLAIKAHRLYQIAMSLVHLYSLKSKWGATTHRRLGRKHSSVVVQQTPLHAALIFSTSCLKVLRWRRPGQPLTVRVDNIDLDVSMVWLSRQQLHIWIRIQFKHDLSSVVWTTPELIPYWYLASYFSNYIPPF